MVSALIAGINAPRKLVSGKSYNVGIKDGNYTVKDLADAVKKIITTSVDKSKLDAVFQKNLDETKEELKKINS